MSAAPVEVGRDAVPMRRGQPTLEWLEVQGEVIVWNAERQELHRLDPIASLVFLLCDGETPLRVTVEQLNEHFAQADERIEKDVLMLVASFVQDGLVQLGGG